MIFHTLLLVVNSWQMILRWTFQVLSEKLKLCLSTEFEERFRDFEKLKPSLLLFNNPMEVNVETQLPELQLELCELHSDPFLLTKKNENPKSFWKLICKDRFPNLRDLALKLHSVFGSTYTCECTFSTMKHVKS
jgi:hypothetical protein